MNFASSASKVKAIAASAAVCLALTAGTWFGGIDPALAQRDRKLAARGELAERQLKSRDLQASLVSVRHELAGARQSLDSAPLHLEPATKVNARIDDLAELASRCGLTINEVQPGTTTGLQHYQTVLITVGGTGPFPSCVRFLHQLRQKFADTGVRSLSISNNDPGSATSPIAFHLQLDWYTAPPAAMTRLEQTP